MRIRRNKEENKENEEREVIVEMLPEATVSEETEPEEAGKMFPTFGTPKLYPKLL